MTTRSNIGGSVVSAAAILLILVAAMSSARADGIDARFLGHWVGTGKVFTDEGGHQSKLDRTIEVDIKPAGTDGFEISNVLVTTFDPAGRGKSKSDQTDPEMAGRVFHPIDAGKRFAGQADCTDPGRERGCVWARFEDDAMIIDAVTVDNQGRQNVMSSRRQLTTDGGMNVSFRRIVDGRLARIVEAGLIRRDK